MSEAAGMLGGLGQAASGVSQLLGTLFGSNQTVNSNTNANGSSSTTTLKGADQDTLRTLMALLQGNAAGFSKDAAINDSAALQDQAIRTLRESVLPGIATSERVAGGYNSTARKSMTDEAIAQAGTDLAALRLNTIGSYGQLQNSNLTSAAAIGNILKGAQTDTKQNTSSATTENTDKEGVLGMLNPVKLISKLF